MIRAASAFLHRAFGGLPIGATGGSGPFGRRASAPATSPPRSSSRRNTLSRDIPCDRATAARCSSSGSSPPKTALDAAS